MLRAAPQHALLSTSRCLRRPEAFSTLLENARNAPSNFLSAESLTSNPQTLTEKIVQRYAVGLADGKKVKSGDYVTVAPHHCMTHDNSWPVALKVQKMGLTKIYDNKQIVMTIDHDVSNKSEANLSKYASIEAFARKHGVDFHESGKGIGHQIMCEEGYAWPGTLTVASDSHSNHYGGLGCLVCVPLPPPGGHLSMDHGLQLLILKIGHSRRSHRCRQYMGYQQDVVASSARCQNHVDWSDASRCHGVRPTAIPLFFFFSFLFCLIVHP